MYLSIKKAIPKIKDKLGKLWLKLKAFFQKNSAKAPEVGADGKLEGQLEEHEQKVPGEEKGASQTELPSDQTNPQVEQARAKEE